jgi:hypothetical protein
MRPRIAILLLMLAAAASTGCAVAHAQPPYGRGPSWDRSSTRDAYESGYHAGFIAGERDARAHRGYDYRDDRRYRDADRGSDRRYGGRGQYRQSYRRGFEAGYREGFDRYASYGTYGRRSGRAREVPYGGYRVPSRPYGNGGYGYGSAAADRGFRDGFEKGREDARDGDRFDPRRHKWYREGDRGYDRDYGAKEYYKQGYRDAFVQGYEQGYRDPRGGRY